MSDKKSLALQTFRFYWPHVRQFPKLYIPTLIILPLNVLCGNYLPPLVLAAVINKLSLHHYNPDTIWADFGAYLVLFAIFSLIGGLVLWRLFDMFWWRLAGKVEKSIYRQVFDHLIHQSADFHANQFGGSLVSATNKLTGSYDRLADTMYFQVGPLIIGLAFVGAVMFPRAPFYTVLLIMFSVLYIFVSLKVSRRVSQKGAEVAAAESKQTGVLADAVTNVMAIKSFAREKDEARRYEKVTDTTYAKLLKMMYAFQRQQIFLGSVSGIMTSLALVIAVISVVSFGSNLATAFLIFSYTSAIASQLFNFSNNSLRNFNRTFGDANDMITILKQKPEVLDMPGTKAWTPTSGAIEFHDITFTHNGSDDAIFGKLNIKIKPGEKIGLVGHSGSGKSTLTRLLLRFSDIDSGEIRVDGQDIAKITQADLHKAIAYVPQEPLLFHRSIRENISYGEPDASDETIKAIAKSASAHEFIETLQHGYDTLVGERGVKLSGGQRQRVAIARAMLKNAPILVLDEATSALDSESEVLIQAALWKLMEGRTAIVIAHRLSTIQKMDRIIVLDDGKIVEEGSHKELVDKKNGTYAKLWAHQSGGFLEED